jgi:hypothetical protein
MGIHNTIRDRVAVTEKVTMTIDDDWSSALYWDPEDDDETKCSWLIESIDERFELVLYVEDKEALKCLIGKFLTDLQELYIGTE